MIQPQMSNSAKGRKPKNHLLGWLWPGYKSIRLSLVPCPHLCGLLTWNWALMLGGFFFLCRCSRDLVVRS